MNSVSNYAPRVPSRHSSLHQMGRTKKLIWLVPWADFLYNVGEGEARIRISIGGSSVGCYLSSVSPVLSENTFCY